MPRDSPPARRPRWLPRALLALAVAGCAGEVTPPAVGDGAVAASPDLSAVSPEDGADGDRADGDPTAGPSDRAATVEDLAAPPDASRADPDLAVAHDLKPPPPDVARPPGDLADPPPLQVDPAENFIWDVRGPRVKVYIREGMFSHYDLWLAYHTSRATGKYFPTTGPGPHFHDLIDGEIHKERNGDCYVRDGMKIWTLPRSGAQYAVESLIVQVCVHSRNLPSGYAYFWRVRPENQTVSKATLADWDSGNSDGIIGRAGTDH